MERTVFESLTMSAFVLPSSIKEKNPRQGGLKKFKKFKRKKPSGACAQTVFGWRLIP